MDYEKKYKEALEKAKQQLYIAECNKDEGKDWYLKYMFPELREPDDEKIRKELLAVINDLVLPDEQQSRFVTWLEKQKPLNNFDEAEKEKNDFVSGQFIECRKSFNEFKEFESYWLEYVGDDTYIGRSDNILNQRFHITPQQLFTLFTHQHCPKENNDEQKENNWNDMIKDLDKVEEYVLSLAPNMPLDAVKVHAKNIRFLVNDGQQPKATPQWMIDFLDEYRRKIGRSMDYDEIRDTDGKVLAIVNWMKGNPNIQQKPIEWSKEDEEFISILIERINQLYVISEKLCKYEDRDRLNPKHKDWLIEKIKSLKPQPKQEWNEEDEKMLERCIDKMSMTAPNLWKKEIDWLKSLKPNHWKPSDEQLNEVKNAIGITGTNGIVLLSLYNNLLKLLIMTQEEKELLLRDLCGRLPYGVILNVGNKDIKLDRQHQSIGILYPEDCSNEFNEKNNSAFYITISGCYYGEDIKPYLRPLSSMTEEEKDEYKNLVRGIAVKDYIALPHINQVDWLNKHHFDYRCLIEKGLALEAPKGMYN